MSDPVQTAPPPAPPTEPPPRSSEDRTMPAVVYALYLVGLATGGLTSILGLILAYVSKDQAGPVSRTHYDFLIRTFWMTLALALVAAALIAIGVPLSFLLIGIPFVVLGGLIFALLAVWYAVRCIVGVVYLAREEAYPRPQTWLV